MNLSYKSKAGNIQLEDTSCACFCFLKSLFFTHPEQEAGEIKRFNYKHVNY